MNSTLQILKLKGELDKAEILQQFYLEGLEKAAAELDTAQKKIEEYKDALATKFNAELCEALKPLRLKLATAKEENKRLRENLDTILNIAALAINPNLANDIEQALKGE